MKIGVPARSQTFDTVQERNGIINALAKMKAGEPFTIAYLGGSITAGAGASNASKTSWRALTTDWFRRQYIHSKITEVNASIGGTGSDFASFRVQTDVLDKHPGLIFIEFAVNDESSPPELIQRSIEGIIRHARSADPTVEICLVYTLSKSMLADFKLGKLPPCIFQQEVVAEHYHISSVNVGAVVAEQINAEKLHWADFSADTCHPTDAGYAQYSDTLTAFLAEQSQHISRPPLPYRLIGSLSSDSFANGELVAATPIATPNSGWLPLPVEQAQGRSGAIVGDAPKAGTLEFKFTGGAIGIGYVLGPDTGNLDYRIDGGEWIALKPFDDFAISGSRIQYRLLSTSLQPGAHNLSLRPRLDKDDRSKGSITRLLFFMVNSKFVSAPRT